MDQMNANDPNPLYLEVSFDECYGLNFDQSQIATEYQTIQQHANQPAPAIEIDPNQQQQLHQQQTDYGGNVSATDVATGYGDAMSVDSFESIQQFQQHYRLDVPENFGGMLNVVEQCVLCAPKHVKKPIEIKPLKFGDARPKMDAQTQTSFRTTSRKTGHSMLMAMSADDYDFLHHNDCANDDALTMSSTESADEDYPELASPTDSTINNNGDDCCWTPIRSSKRQMEISSLSKREMHSLSPNETLGNSK